MLIYLRDLEGEFHIYPVFDYTPTSKTWTAALVIAQLSYDQEVEKQHSSLDR